MRYLQAEPQDVAVVIEMIKSVIVAEDPVTGIEEVVKRVMREARAAVDSDTVAMTDPVAMENLFTRWGSLVLTGTLVASAAVTESAYATGVEPLEFLASFAQRWRTD